MEPDPGGLDSKSQWTGTCLGRYTTTGSSVKLATVIFILVTTNPNVSAQCTSPSQSIITVTETDPAGTTLFSLPAPNDVRWRYVFKEPAQSPFNNYVTFRREGSAFVMKTTKPLDVEALIEVDNVGEVYFSLILYCHKEGEPELRYSIGVAVTAVSEFPPVFNTTEIVVDMDETQNMYVPVVTLSDFASDKDYNPVTAEIATYGLTVEPNPWFRVLFSRGLVQNIVPLDYETLPAGAKYIKVGVFARDSADKTATTSLRVNIRDVDDTPPRFTYATCPTPCDTVDYSVKVSSNYTGLVGGMKPAPILAEDGDSLGAEISYSIGQGPAGYGDFVTLDPNTAELTVVKPLDSYAKTDLVLLVKATERTALKRSTSTSLLVSVLGPGITGGGTDPVGSGTTNTGSVRSGGGTDTVLIVGLVMGVIIIAFIVVLVVAAVVFRKRYRKSVHPDASSDVRNDAVSAGKPGNGVSRDPNGMKGRSLQEHQKSMRLSEEGMKGEEEITTWLPNHQLSDMIDLSDEETLRRKQKNGKPPCSTQMASRDSAFDESSDKKSGSESSHRDPDLDPEFDPATEYAELKDMPCSAVSQEHKTERQDHVYVPDPTVKDDSKAKDIPTTDSGVEEAEYLTPTSVRVKGQPNDLLSSSDNNTPRHVQQIADVTSGTYSDIISLDDNPHQEKIDVHPEVIQPVTAHLANLEHKTEALEENSTIETSLAVTLSNNETKNNADDESEITEYSTPKSQEIRSVTTHPPFHQQQRQENLDKDLPAPELSDIADGDVRPEVPPRPTIKKVSGLKADEEIHYASVQKKSPSHLKNVKSSQYGKESPPTQSPKHLPKKSKHTARIPDQDIEGPREDTGSLIDPPVRRKRLKKRAKAVKAPEEDIYDGTKDYEDLEMDPEFYLDKTKTRVKRSSRTPSTLIDPDDTKYWITVPNDY